MRRSFHLFAALLQDPRPGMSNRNLISDFKEWKFHHPPNYAQQPIDRNPNYNQPVAVKNAVFSEVPTEPITGKLRLVCASDEAMMDILDLDPKVAESEEFIHFIAGAYLPEGGLSVSHRYGGYQFGYWADQLGDGRAHILGEYINNKGESWQPQLKGSGETPYSRFGDGRAVLRSSIREMIASEACHHLGIPTTRAAALVASDDPTVWRDKNYSGCARQERAAVVLRLAPAWYRIGSLEILYKRGETDLMKTLVDFIIQHHFPDIDPTAADKYVQWYAEVARRNLDMVATWQGFGFTHGVLNTDNVSLLGLTVDYGPFGFLDHYYEHYVANGSDDGGRYAFNRQPDVILWNLDKFAEAISPILAEDQKKAVGEVRATLEPYVKEKILKTYLLKLGLDEVKDDDAALVRELLQLMQHTAADFTATFHQLAEVAAEELAEGAAPSQWALRALCAAPRWPAWARRYRDRLREEGVSEAARRARAARANPALVPRNWMLQEAVAAAERNDFAEARQLLRACAAPYAAGAEAARRGYLAPPPSWAYGLKLSCSS